MGLLAVAGRAIEVGTLDALAGVAAIAVERVQFLEERKAAEMDRRSAELKSALLASLAHDLRTPLTAIRVAASNLQAEWANDEERRAQSEIVLAEVERLSRLFQNILDMARIETNAVTASREWVTPEEIVEAAMTQVQHTLGGHRIAATAAGDQVVEVDPRLTSAALAHLLENAAQYSPLGTTISIQAAAAATTLTIVVEDQGPGIAKGDLPHLFERFFRGRAATGRSAGAGMGLAIARGLLAAQGGTIWGENGAGGGARFSIAVPAAMRPVADQPQEAEAGADE
jgi:two-component system sensor histidine kinase KdpD